MSNNFSFQKNQTRGPFFKNIIEKIHDTHRTNFIFNRSANICNSLPNRLVNAETVNGYKADIVCWMSSNYANRLSYCAENTLTTFLRAIFLKKPSPNYKI